jgi:hypothetical protein
MGDIELEKCPVRNIAERVDLLDCRGMEVIYSGMTDAYGYEYDEGYVLMFIGKKYTLIGDVANHETRLQFLVQPELLHRFGWIGANQRERLEAWHKARRVQLLRNRQSFIAAELCRLCQ